MSVWNDHRVLVTGATGLVGAWLVKALLKRGAYVVALVRDADPQSELFRSRDIQRVNVVSGALEDYATVERSISGHEVDTVFHLAAQPLVGIAYRSPLATFESNIRGTYHVLEACRVHAGIVERVVIASSDKAYGPSEVLPYTENMPLSGRQPYEVSKSCADLLAQSYFHSYALPVAIARCGNVYGGADLNWSRIVPGTIRSLLRHEAPIIRSDGTFVRDYIYVKDVAEAYVRLAERAADDGVSGEAFNFSPESAISVLDLVNLISQLMGRPDLAPDVRASARGEIVAQCLDSSRARKRLGWRPTYSLETGLTETIAWYRNFLQSEAPE